MGVNPVGVRGRASGGLASAFVLVVMALATLVFWIGIPIGGLWLFSKLTDSWTGHFLLSVLLIPVAMALFTPALFWLNSLYLRTIGAVQADDDEELPARRLGGPLEMLLVMGLVAAVALLVIWFVFYAKYPLTFI